MTGFPPVEGCTSGLQKAAAANWRFRQRAFPIASKEPDFIRVGRQNDKRERRRQASRTRR